MAIIPAWLQKATKLYGTIVRKISKKRLSYFSPMTTIEKHFSESSKTILSLKNFKKEINEIIESILKCTKNKKKILIAGNGGSCADAEHFAGELSCTFNKRDRKSFSVIPLTSHSAALTAWSNDFGFESFFKRQVNAHGNEDDILFLLSTGGGNLSGSKA